jgi:small subunit ribosomal protein S1
LRVIEVDPQRRRLVLSERKAVRAWRQERKAQVMESLQEGEVRSGIVTSVRDFGAFVDIGGADGLIHISELSWKHVDSAGDVIHEGQQVEAVVVRLDRQSNRISLSLKRLQPNPWLEAAARLSVGASLEATVARFDKGEVVATVEPGVEGRLPWPEGEPPEPGTRLAVRVAAFEPERERLGLQLEQGQPEAMS